MGNLLTNNLIVLTIVIGVPAVFAWLLTLVNRRSKANLVNRFGINSQVYCGFLGIMLHEISHLFVALIFRHGIQSVRLIKLPHLHADQTDDLALGYVNHTWNRNSPYQVIGNLFIGVAPIFGCTAALLGLDFWLAPGIGRAIVHLAATPEQLDWQGSLQLLMTSPTNWWQLGLLLLLSLSIILGGFDLSPADYENSALGLYSTCGGLVVLTSLATLIGWTGWMAPLIAWGLTVAIILGSSLIVSILVMVLTFSFTDH
ncbi:hypothetical protein [Lactiplantibacillus plajomi]|uniref:Integral membrane protein n=1 Tax=Lactiplantibacillus plajomi TaxID=1457217 RepID=A0ABV6K0C9_9LACO|nr:hypothetical protein [Lactiplantibacillus plajomi]